MSNRTQTHISVAALLVAGDWLKREVRTLEVLESLAETYAQRGVFNSGPLPENLVRSEALRLLRERVPEVAPLPAPGAHDNPNIKSAAQRETPVDNMLSTDRLSELRAAASQGADLSPGDPLTAWAVGEIERLRAVLQRMISRYDGFTSAKEMVQWAQDGLALSAEGAPADSGEEVSLRRTENEVENLHRLESTVRQFAAFLKSSAPEGGIWLDYVPTGVLDAFQPVMRALRVLAGETSPAEPSRELLEISRLRGLASNCLAIKPTAGTMRRTLEKIAG